MGWPHRSLLFSSAILFYTVGPPGARHRARAAPGLNHNPTLRAPIKGVMYPQAVRRTPTADGSPDHPHPPDPRLHPPDADPAPGPGRGRGRQRRGSPTPTPTQTRQNAHRTGQLVRQAGPVWARARADGLTGEDVRNLNALLQHAMAANTKANYRYQWRRFTEWARARGVCALPADPGHVAAYLAERIEREGHKPATLWTAASVIAFIHKAAELANPCAAAEVKRVLSSATRKAGKRQKQAAALTADALARIRATADKPREGRGGWSESQETAMRRGRVDGGNDQPDAGCHVTGLRSRRPDLGRHRDRA